jgi:hypothetical protein
MLLSRARRFPFIVNVPAGQWHNLKSLDSGTILAEAKDGKYEPLSEEDILQK